MPIGASKCSLHFTVCGRSQSFFYPLGLLLRNLCSRDLWHTHRPERSLLLRPYTDRVRASKQLILFIRCCELVEPLLPTIKISVLSPHNPSNRTCSADESTQVIVKFPLLAEVRLQLLEEELGFIELQLRRTVAACHFDA